VAAAELAIPAERAADTAGRFPASRVGAGAGISSPRNTKGASIWMCIGLLVRFGSRRVSAFASKLVLVGVGPGTMSASEATGGIRLGSFATGGLEFVAEPAITPSSGATACGAAYARTTLGARVAGQPQSSGTVLSGFVICPLRKTTSSLGFTW